MCIRDRHYTVHVDEPAERADGSTFSDHDVRARLAEKGFPKVDLEWMTCSNIDVKVAIAELRTGTAYEGSHHETFPMRPEQSNAVAKAHAYFHSIWKEDMHAVPRFLWNAKMRFGKTFTAYRCV